MKYAILLLLLFYGLLPATALAQGPDDDSDTVVMRVPAAPVRAADLRAVRTETARLMDSIHAITDTLRRISVVVSEENSITDTSAVEMAKRDPEGRLYMAMITHGMRHNGWRVFRFVFSIALMLTILVSGILLARNAGLIRDASYDTTGRLRPVNERPFSFARVQLLWWTLIITVSYVYFFGLTGVLVPINTTTAILLGGGVLVYAGGKLIDNKQIRDAGGLRHQDQGDAACQGFFTDILSDESGISMHRFQAVIFNVIFGTAFVAYFMRNIWAHQYPLIDFSEGQFALLGISSAAFLGLKATENKTLPQPVDLASKDATSESASTGPVAGAGATQPTVVTAPTTVASPSATAATDIITPSTVTATSKDAAAGDVVLTQQKPEQNCDDPDDKEGEDGDDGNGNDK